MKEIVQHGVTFKAANFNRKMCTLTNNPNRSKFEQSDLHKEVKSFLKSKCLYDGGEELKTDKEVDEYGEKFVLACNEAIGGMSESIHKDRGFHANLTRDLNLETTTPVKEIGTEQLRAVTDSAGRQNDTAETSKLSGIKEVGLNLDTTQEAIVRENDDQVIKKLQQ